MANDIMQPEETSSSGQTKTLTEVELFWRFFDTPIRFRTASAPVAPPDPDNSTIRRKYLVDFAFKSDCFRSFNLSKWIIEQLRASDDPYAELEAVVFDIHGILESLYNISAELELIRDAMRTKRPDKDAPDEELREWEDNPRYVVC